MTREEIQNYINQLIKSRKPRQKRKELVLKFLKEEGLSDDAIDHIKTDFNSYEGLAPCQE
jgi:hypothetical protein